MVWAFGHEVVACWNITKDDDLEWVVLVSPCVWLAINIVAYVDSVGVTV